MKSVSLWSAGAIMFLLMAGAAFGDETPWYKNIDIAADMTDVFQGSPGVSAANIDGAVKPSMSFDVEFTLQTSKSGTAYVKFKSGVGEGIDALIPTFSGFNGDAYDDLTPYPAEAWYEHAFGEKARLRFGKLDLTTDFDTNAIANSETEQFLSGGFVNNAAVALPDDNSLGAMLWVSPIKLFDVGFGFADAAADWDNVFKNPFFILELDLKPEIKGKPGNYRFYAWHNGKDHERLIVEGTDPNYGYGISADQEVADGITAFFRYGRQRSGVAPANHVWSAGAEISGKIPRRENDSVGIAYGQSIIGNGWKSLAQEAGIDSCNESHLELYYKVKVTDFMSVSPNVQWVNNSEGNKGNKGVWAFGFRMQFNANILKRRQS